MFESTVNILTIFREKLSIFHTRYQVLNIAKNMKNDFSTYAGIVNQEWEKCKLELLTEDQFKCLIFVLGLKSPWDKEIQAKLLAKVEQDAYITLQFMSEECQRIINQKHDSAQIEKPEMQIEIQAVQKMAANNSPTLQILVTNAVDCISK